MSRPAWPCLPLLLAACTHPDGATATGGLERLELPALNGDPASLRSPGPDNGIAQRLAQLGSHPGRQTLAPDDEYDLPENARYDLLDQIGPPLSGGRWDMSLGGDLEDRLAEEDPDDVATYGVSLLTLDELFGTSFGPGLCRSGAVSVDGELDGRAYTATFDAPTYFWISDPKAYMTTISQACKDALLASGGRVASAIDNGCVEDDAAEFFEEGSDCRTCLQDHDGDFDGCVDRGACVEDSPVEFWISEDGEQRWYDAVSAKMFACAPDWLTDVFLLADVADDGTLPQTFDHAAWAYLCLPYWSRGVTYTCIAGTYGPQIGDALGEGVTARMIGVQWEDNGEITDPGRMVYTHELQIDDGDDFGYFWAFTPTGAGVISMPQVIPDSNGDGVTDLGDENFGFGLGGWGMNPHDLRPDGTDPENLDDTMARDWMGVFVLKFSTEINGIPIHIFDHDRCHDGAWEGPYDDGSYRCTQMDAPKGEWLLDDVDNTWTDSTWTSAYALPMATIASTGLPDPDVATGAVPFVAGSPAIANPDWESCTWPHQFTPDLAPMEDTPGVFGEQASLWAQTYRFGKDPDQDLRTVLVTNRLRNFCPPEGR